MTPPGLSGVAADLAREHLALGRCLVVTASGHSMWPALRDGERVEIRPLLGAPRVGDVVLISLGGTLCLHRVVQRDPIGPGSLLTKGDAASAPDPPLARADVLGRWSRRAATDPVLARVSLWGGRPLSRGLGRLRTWLDGGH